MSDWNENLKNAIADKSCTQDDVAAFYADAILENRGGNFTAVNDAIRKRWKSKSSLARIKEKAWKLVTRISRGG